MRGVDRPEAGNFEAGQFITTEPLTQSGYSGEKQVWEAVCQTFATRPCLGYWRYPIFALGSGVRKEPDILIADRELGLMVIEVKSIAIDCIRSISGHQWQFQNFYTTHGNPYQQGESQLYALLDYCDREPLLARHVRARAIVALPQITRSQWQERGFHRLPTSPPILFRECFAGDDRAQYSPSVSLLEAIERAPLLRQGTPLDNERWQLLLAVLAGTPLYRRRSRRVLAPGRSRALILAQARERLNPLDLQQERIGKEIPPGPQRIRGIAGSGKTVLLCQKAAQMHLKHPDWEIAIVFFTRALYEPIVELLDRWLQRFSGGELGYDRPNPKLRVLNAWGSRNRPGLYGLLCEATGVGRLAVNDLKGLPPNVALAKACCQLLEKTAIPQIFNAILIDEAQDLMVDDRHRFGDKQPFYWMAYQALKPANPENPQEHPQEDPPLRRLIWADDEAQCLESANSPTAGALFGSQWSNLVTGQYPGGIRKSEVMGRGYRTPAPILMTAHALGMGLLRSGGMLRGMTQRQDWQAIGYEVCGRFATGEPVTLYRSHSANPIPELWPSPVIEFETYRSRQEELTALAECIWHNLKYDGLRPSREILVVVVGSGYEVARLEVQVARFLMARGIDIFIPTMPDCNVLPTGEQRRDRQRFWCVGGVTVSRIHRAKGHEADMVYVVGVDRVAIDERNTTLRNQLFVALTRSRGWLRGSGIGDYPLYEEFARAIAGGERLTFTVKGLPEREMTVTPIGELLRRYAPGRETLAGADLTGAILTGIDLRGVDLLQTQLVRSDLQGAILDGAILAIANLTGANLARSSLKKAKLVGAILVDADLTGANLAGANLSGADLTGATLRDANLDGANWVDAILPDGRVGEDREHP